MRILLTGASGLFGGYLLRQLKERGADVVAWTATHSGTLFGVGLHPVDLGTTEAVVQAFRETRPECVLHTAALSSIADCHRDPERAWRINVTGSALLAAEAETVGARFLHISTDLVFDGEQGHYREEDLANPLSVYGRSKLAAEEAVKRHGQALIVRCSLLFGPSLTPRRGFFDQQLSALRGGQSLKLFHDEWRSPLSLRTAARALTALADSDQVGLLHLGGPERMTRLEMGERLAKYLGLESPTITACSRQDAPAAEPRPRDVSLDSSRWRALFSSLPWPNYEDALAEMLGAVGNEERN
jgi:dTDP-4-dehydrorhamnose reductase